ncbi:uncharacterized protein MONBRDRAFT_34785 [Monosiga brevicollis MX1]|uniref:ubiquitinyl hydrolase 1 n=1 Tax=Monosiga brevicollis TaxID=81824 RepID=A9VE26_MONBE|nr:uncharacterized protein MONBRDRAFT_34785 [Monosiga brevicollis MX1]EDQ84236.1 predicted protein [Monosiga brevicollis MX1]|eukprot:XP_001750960.1 hypothetical protein [Monosiga brevicollis MX1]
MVQPLADQKNEANSEADCEASSEANVETARTPQDLAANLHRLGKPCLLVHALCLEYGCAIVSRTNAGGDYHLEVLSLDVHALQYLTPPNKPVLLSRGQQALPVGVVYELEKAQEVAETALEVAGKLRYKSKKSQNQEKKHHSTPGFIHGACKHALTALQTSKTPVDDSFEFTDGTLDFGQHTHTAHKPTAWPVLRELVLYALRIRQEDPWASPPPKRASPLAEELLLLRFAAFVTTSNAPRKIDQPHHKALQRWTMLANTFGQKLRAVHDPLLHASFCELCHDMQISWPTRDEAISSTEASCLPDFDNLDFDQVSRHLPQDLAERLNETIADLTQCIPAPLQALDLEAICQDLGESIPHDTDLFNELNSGQVTIETCTAYRPNAVSRSQKLSQTIRFRLLFEQLVHGFLTRVDNEENLLLEEGQDQRLMELLACYREKTDELMDILTAPEEPDITTPFVAEVLAPPGVLRSKVALMEAGVLVILRCAAEQVYERLGWTKYPMPQIDEQVKTWTLPYSRDQRCCQQIVRFLRSRVHRANQDPLGWCKGHLFGLDSDFAQNYADWSSNTYKALRSRLVLERKHDEEKKARHWKETLEKQKTERLETKWLQENRPHLKTAHRELESALAEADMKRRLYERHYGQCPVYYCIKCQALSGDTDSAADVQEDKQRQYDRWNTTVESHEETRMTARKPPYPVQLSLPKDDLSGLQALFILFTPLRFQVLMKAMITVVLQTHDKDQSRPDQYKSSKSSFTPMQTFFNEHKAGDQDRAQATDACFPAFWYVRVARTTSQYSNVGALDGREDDVYYMRPEEGQPYAVYKRKSLAEIVALYGALPPDDKNQADDSSSHFRHIADTPVLEDDEPRNDRGNYGKAFPYALGWNDSLEASEAISALRAGALAQWQQLAAVLRTGVLPLSDARVARTCLAILAEVGPVNVTTENDKAHGRRWAWTTQDDHAHKAFLVALDGAMARLGRATKLLPDAATLGALAGCLTAFDRDEDASSEYSPGDNGHKASLTAFDLLMKLTDFLHEHAREWAKQLNHAIQNGYHKEADDLTQRRFDAFSLALLAFRFVDWRVLSPPKRQRALRRLVCLRILSSRQSLMAEAPSEAVSCRNRVFSDATNTLMTEALHFLHPELMDALNDASFAAQVEAWCQESLNRPGGEASTSRNGTSSCKLGRNRLTALVINEGEIAINMLTGDMLFNGKPPGLLPPRMLQDDSYRNLFGDRRFKVTSDRDGRTYRSVAPFDGHHYRFTVKNNRLNIYQTPEDHRDDPEHELLYAPEIKTGAKPIDDLHVPWMSPATKSVVWRKDPTQGALNIQAQVAAYVCVADENQRRSLLRVPSNQDGSSIPKLFHKAWEHVSTNISNSNNDSSWFTWIWPEAVQAVPELLQLSKVLKRVDSLAYITWHLPTEGVSQLEIDLLQCGTQLSLIPAEGLLSITHRGYRLAKDQLLHNLLPSHTAYLVLERHDGGSRPADLLQLARQVVLMPDRDGESAKPKPGQLPRIRTFIFSIHGILGHLEAASRMSRLFLAREYSRLPMHLMEKNSGLFVADKAAELLRESSHWAQAPTESTLEEEDYIWQMADKSESEFALLRLRALATLRQGRSWDRQADDPCKEWNTPSELAWYQMVEQELPVTARLDRSERDVLEMPQPSGRALPRPFLGDCELDTDGSRISNADRASHGSHTTQTLLDAARTEADKIPSVRAMEEELLHLVTQRPVPRMGATDSTTTWAAELDNLKNNKNILPEHRERLTSLLLEIAKASRDKTTKPAATTSIGRHLHQQLEKSKELHDYRASVQFDVSEQSVEAILAKQRTRIDSRQALWQAIAAVLNPTMSENVLNDDPICARYQLLLTSGHMRQASPRGLLYICAGRDAHECWSRACEFNFFINLEDMHHLLKLAKQWMELCVLEQRVDRLSRLVQCMYAVSKDEQEGLRQLLLLELTTTRLIWQQPADHEFEMQRHQTGDDAIRRATERAWLVFEVENQLQIRPKQYHVAWTLIRDSKAGKAPLLQLNMGEGKSKVILPLLLLHQRVRRRSQRPLPFVFFLPQLVDQSLDHLQRTLTASVFQLPLLQLHFDRQVTVEANWLPRARQRLEALRRTDGGAVVLRSSDLLSPELKCIELNSCAPALSKGLRDLLKTMPRVHIYDEIDKILDFHYELIYADGPRQAVSRRAERVAACQTLLSLLHHPTDDMNEAMLMSDGTKWIVAEHREQCSDPSAFAVPLVVSDSVPLEKKMQLLRAMCRALCSTEHDTRPELKWLQGLTSSDKHHVEEFLCEPTASLHDSLGGALAEDKRAQLCVLRGLLAHGILVQVLHRRVNVNYGSDNRRKKQLSVPYEATDSPTTRSEFADIDKLLVMTHLTWYTDGLSLEGMQDALQRLGRLQPSRQETVYQSWRRAAGEHIKQHQRVPDKADELDVKDSNQVQRVWECFRRNYECINFWLREVVLPRDTCEYPKRLQATPWHLADVPEQMGFSGTNDTNLTLPFAVCPVPDMNELVGAAASLRPTKEDVDRELAATNGMMVRALEAHCVRNEVLCLDNIAEGPDTPVMELVLAAVLKEGAHALIDVGAQLAGKSLSACAKYIFENSTWTHVVYSLRDPRQRWVVHHRNGVIENLRQSAVASADALVIYDQFQCRGADHKLKQQAKAIITLGKNVCKDELMQAAGRLRQLQRGQKFLFAAPKYVLDAIQKLPGRNASQRVEIQDVIEFVMANTKSRNLGGLHLWAKQGLQFAYSKVHEGMFVLDEINEPESCYGMPNDTLTVKEAAKRYNKEVLEPQYSTLHAECDRAECEDGLQRGIARVLKHCGRYGLTQEELKAASAAALGEDLEIEREEQQEEEEQEEVEQEVLSVEPKQESLWNVEILLQGSPKELKTLPLKMLKTCAALKDLRLNWPANTEFFCTQNWYQWSAGLEHETRLPYVRACVVRFEGGERQITIVTEREVDRLYQHETDPYVRLPHAWPHDEKKACIVQLPQTSTPRSAYDEIKKELERAWMNALRESEDPREVVQKLLAPRNAQLRYPESQVAAICDQLSVGK